MSVLDRIVAEKRVEVARLESRAEALRAAAESAVESSAAESSAGGSETGGGTVTPGGSAIDGPRGFAEALGRAREEVALIAEVKRRSPSAGEIRPDLSPAEVASAYEAAGASAISVLTDETFFGGDLADLVAVREAVALPVLRKDFVVAPVQLWEARAAGADAVLLIVRILEDARLAELLALAEELGMDALVEVHDGEELERALACGTSVVGVNNRDLSTFRTDPAVTFGLADAVPADRVLVAESGIRTASDVDRFGSAGADAVLVGESLMRAPELEGAARRLVGRARVERGGAVEATS